MLRELSRCRPFAALGGASGHNGARARSSRDSRRDARVRLLEAKTFALGREFHGSSQSWKFMGRSSQDIRCPRYARSQRPRAAPLLAPFAIVGDPFAWREEVPGGRAIPAAGVSGWRHGKLYRSLGKARLSKGNTGRPRRDSRGWLLGYGFPRRRSCRGRRTETMKLPCHFERSEESRSASNPEQDSSLRWE